MQKQSVKERYETLFTLYTDALNGHGNEPIAMFRKAGFEQFRNASFPTRRDEDWKYSGIGKLLNRNIQSFPGVANDIHTDNTFLEALNAITLLFINGEWVNGDNEFDGLPDEVTIAPVADMLKDESKKAWIYEVASLKGGTDKNAFHPLNLSFADNGIYIEVEAKYAFNRPIHLCHISLNNSAEETYGAHPQVFIKAAKDSQLEIIESYHGFSESQPYFNNALKIIDVAANARLDHYKLQLESAAAFHVNNTIVRQGRDSVYSMYNVDLGGNVTRNNISATLTSTGIETNMFGIYLADGNQQIDNQTFIDHATPHCQSNELYKGIITDKAKGVFNGKVLVRQDAQKINAFQQNNSLVLSETAVMDTKPQLEIYADDVRCSHGATIGQLDEQAIFYLRSRGIKHERAKKILQQAFVGEVAEKIPNAIIRDQVHQLIEAQLSRA